ncbi:MAG TPA: hypothetical protein VFD48_03545 [Pyrinomonadaceae bacterium]|nr:hypothetical protein [Pyrinomonadaceae bacterium]
MNRGVRNEPGTESPNKASREGMICRINCRLFLPAISIVGIVFALTTNIESVPPLWRDEGWTISVARNWVELGHYGRLKNGALAPRGLEGGTPVVASVALSFLLFDVGVYQARLVFVAYTLAALALLYYLAHRFYNRAIAIGSLGVLIFLSSHADLHPFIMGRQVLGEVPAIVFLLLGLMCFLFAGEKSLWFILPSILFWSIALITKAQVQPFWVMSLAIPLMVTLCRRNWRAASLLGAGLIGAYLLSLAWLQFIAGLQSMHRPPLSGLTQVIALALNKHSRSAVLMETYQFGLPTLLGFCWAFWVLLRKSNHFENHTDVVRLAFLVLAGSWFAWYEFLSIGWVRYMFPPVFLGSIFVAAMLFDWTERFNFASTIKRAGGAIRSFHLSSGSLSALAAIVLVAMSLARTGTILYGAYVVTPDNSVMEVAQFLNTRTSPQALIETYESELLAFLKRRYHYPPDQTAVELIRKFSFGERVTIDYDPLAADPDFLVIGPTNRFWDFYDPYLKTGAFRLLQSYSRYDIYERVRTSPMSPNS